MQVCAFADIMQAHENSQEKDQNIMSASTERKNRIAAREAGTDKKTLAMQEEEKKKAKSKRRWTWGTIGVIVLIVAIFLLNSNLMYTSTTALTANGVKYSPAQVNYFYGTEYLNLANSYGSYLGLDSSMGLSGLDDQECQLTDGGTWRDYFRNMAEMDVQQNQALLDYAKENGITLTDEEIAEVDAGFEGIEEMAKNYGYSSPNALYAMNYGSGVTQQIAREAALNAALAQKASDTKRDSLTWTDEELEEHYQSFNGDRDYFDFYSYFVTAETIEQTVEPESEPAEGEETAGSEETTPETKMVADDTSRAEAKATADAIVMAYKDGDDIEDPVERFSAAVESQTEAEPTERSNVAGSSLASEYAEWMKADRQEGDVEVFADAETDPTGYTVVMFVSRNDNHYNTASVRHILIKAEASEDGSYSDEAKEAAKTRAEEILAEFEAGEKTEERFAELAEQYSEDEGSNTNGGLYENIAQGQMVQEFNDFCFADHKPGDTGIVYGESGSYAGYHVMYYVGEGGLYSSYLAKSELQSTAIDEWMTELNNACEVTEGFGFRFVGK